MKEIPLLLTFFLCSMAPGLRLNAATPGLAHFPTQMQFTENKGQWHSNFCFRANVAGGNVRLEKNAFYFFLYDARSSMHAHHPGPLPGRVIQGHSFKEEFVNANTNVQLTGEHAFVNICNYYLGNNPAYWAGNVKNYAAVRYSNLYNNIDMRVYGYGPQHLKYDLLVNAGGDVSQVKINYTGPSEMGIRRGDLVITTSAGEVVEQKPYAYQEINGKRVEVKCRFVLEGTTVYFELPDGYDKSYQLVIDPNIVFSTYTGSTADNWGYTATYDDQGNMYLGGYVNVDQFGPTTSYPTTPGAFQTTWGGGTGTIGGNPPQDQGSGIAYACDMGISKFSPDGTQLLYSTYIGGDDNETPHSLVVDPQGNLIIYGVAYSANYPVTAGAFDPSYNGNGDIVVTKLNATGTALIASTFIGGSENDGINFDPHEGNPGFLKRNYGDQNRGEVNIDAAGNIYVASCTRSLDFPVSPGAFQNSFGGLQDGCAFKLNAACSQVLWASYLGGSAGDACYSLDLGPNNVLYVAGGTMSGNFPTTSGTLHTGYLGGQYDGFLACISATGTQLVASTYMGTGADDQVYFVKLDGAGNVYMVGQTTGSYPVVNALYSNPNSGQFIAKVNPAFNSVLYSTVFGNGNGRPNISPTAFLVDTCENVYVAGWGCAQFSIFVNPFGFTPNIMTGMPITPDAIKPTTDGTDFYFFVISKNAQSLLYASYFGGNGEEHVDGGTSRFDKRGVIYEAICAGCGGTSFTPTTQGVWAENNGSDNCNELGLKVEFNLAGTSVELQAFPRATGCVPLTVQFHGTVNNAQSFTWYFGDGGTAANNLSPVHVYTDTGTYRVMLVGLDSNSCNISDTAFLEVWVRDDSLTADFLPNLSVNCDSNRVMVQSAYQSATATYAWALGDNSTAATPLVTHQYAAPGLYTINLIVSDTARCNLQDTFTAQVRIPIKLDADFGLSDSAGCTPLTVNFNSTIYPTAHYTWNFGDGTVAQQPAVTHTYNTADTFLVQLVIYDTSACHPYDTAYARILTIDSSADAGFVFSRTFYGCDSVQITAWSAYQGADAQLWDFGDGTPSSTADTVSHVYNTAGTFTITHYLTDQQQICHPFDTAQITVSLLPLNISVTVPDTGGCLPFTAQFTGNSALLSTRYYWFFGDGDSTDGAMVTHTFTQTGTYNVVVLATDTNACVGGDSAFATITVIDDFVTADFQLNVLNDCDSNLVIDLVNQSANAVNYTWLFSDGSTSTQANEGHTFNLPGTYTVTLIAVDTNRCHPADTLVKSVTMLPNVALDFSVQNVCLGTPVQFVNMGNPTAQFNWNFGDNGTSQQYAPAHQYTTANTYDVVLTVIDTGTCDLYDTVTHSVNVYQQPLAGFSIADDTFKYETPVKFVNTSIRYRNLLWNFGDGDTSDEERPYHTYESLGWMTVCLRAYNDVCDDTACRDIFISFSPLIGVPNAFTPNGDGINDVVKVEGKGIIELVFRIYNRWGEKVFESADQNIGWDGVYKGVLQEMDVFSYAVEATFVNGYKAHLKGNITLLR